mmetsp:Transcript_17266/g.20030  ORF Transcript_17266/g.20030 Transcript_17266/m.20030 type:complete len:86 (+) Transcript_17266:328-585(+)
MVPPLDKQFLEGIDEKLSACTTLDEMLKTVRGRLSSVQVRTQMDGAGATSTWNDTTNNQAALQDVESNASFVSAYVPGEIRHSLQ